MKTLATPVRISEQEIRRKATEDNKFSFNRLQVRNRTISRTELRYVEYFVMEYQMIHREWFGLKKEQEPKTQTVYLLGNGSTGYTSYMEVLPQTIPIDAEENNLQKADYSVDQMSGQAKITLLKLFRRHIGGRIPQFRLVSARSLYRPFWLVYYDGAKKDGRTLCAVLNADGYQVGR